MLTISFKIQEPDGSVSVRSLSRDMRQEQIDAGFQSVNMALHDKRKLKFMGASYRLPDGSVLESGINERWSVADMRRYLASCDSEAVFRLCERLGTRKAASGPEREAMRIVPKTGLAPDFAPEWLPYLDLDRALADAAQGAGPLSGKDFIALSEGNVAILG